MGLQQCLDPKRCVGKFSSPSSFRVRWGCARSSSPSSSPGPSSEGAPRAVLPQMHRHLPHVRRGGPKPKLRKVKMHSTFLPSLPGVIHIDLQLSVMDVSVRSAHECLAQRARSSHAEIEIGVPFWCCADACLFLSGTIGLQVVATWGARRCWQWFYCQRP